MMRITCFHTADSNVAIFDSACYGLDLALVHTVRPELLAAVERAGCLSQAVVDETLSVLRALSTDCDAVILTCSTLGPIACRMTTQSAPILRADATLARLAVGAGRHLVGLCTAETTLEPTAQLLRDVSSGVATPPRIEVRLVADAWGLFKAGRLADYYALIARAADAAIDEGADVVALMQVSMTGAASLGKRDAVLTIPRVALEAAVRIASPTAAEHRRLPRASVHARPWRGWRR